MMMMIWRSEQSESDLIMFQILVSSANIPMHVLQFGRSLTYSIGTRWGLIPIPAELHWAYETKLNNCRELKLSLFCLLRKRIIMLTVFRGRQRLTSGSHWRRSYFRSTSVFSALEVFYENALYKFTFDIDIDNLYIRLLGGTLSNAFL